MGRTTLETRCAWAESDDLMRAYHDEEWGVPVHDDLKLFEHLMLVRSGKETENRELQHLSCSLMIVGASRSRTYYWIGVGSV